MEDFNIPKEPLQTETIAGKKNRIYGSGSSGLNPKEEIWMYRSTVLTPGLVILIIVGGPFCISLKGIDVKTDLIRICTVISCGAIRTLAGLLTPSPNRL